MLHILMVVTTPLMARLFAILTTCNGMGIHGKKFQKYSNRLGPEPALLQQFLTTNSEFKNIIDKDDRVCYACYKFHLVTVKKNWK